MARQMPQSGFQAFILCGPGVSLNTFTSNPEEFPKALVPIANRPMVWYPLDWCYRMGLANITLITPPASRPALEAALSQNPHLTSLPLPSPSVISPTHLTYTTGTAELLRLSEVQACIESDFLLLPCDLVCELPGEYLLETWMSDQAALDGTSVSQGFALQTSSLVGVNGERGGRRGGIGVWYPMPTKEEGVKDDIADFLAISPMDCRTPVVRRGDNGVPFVRSSLSNLVYAAPMDSLKDAMEKQKALLLRSSLLKKHGKVKMLTRHRDAHIYMFPHWVKEWARRNEQFESVSEDLVGWWAKAGWQKGLSAKLGFDKVLASSHKRAAEADAIEGEVDLINMSSTKPGKSALPSATPPRSITRSNTFSEDDSEQSLETCDMAPLLAYVHASRNLLIQRVDNPSLLLAMNLRLARLPSVHESEITGNSASAFAHIDKIAYPEGIATRCTVTRTDCLIGDNVTVEERSVIKESVIGANCCVRAGARLNRCVLMDGVTIEGRCQLQGCIIGRRSRIGAASVLKDCEVQDGNVIAPETDAKNEKFMVFEGLDDEGADEGEDESERDEGENETNAFEE